VPVFAPPDDDKPRDKHVAAARGRAFGRGFDSRRLHSFSAVISVLLAGQAPDGLSGVGRVLWQTRAPVTFLLLNAKWETAMRHGFSSVAEWHQLKRELRLEDARAIRDGEKSKEDVKRENSHIRVDQVRLRLDPSRL
jgi:hypothetical protein